MLMYAGLVGKGIGAHNGLVPLDLKASQGRNHPGSLVNLASVNVGADMIMIGPNLQGHHDLLERTIAGPLAQAINGTLDLAGTGANGRKRIGNGQAQIVVAVNGNDGIGYIGDIGYQIGNNPVEVLRSGVANRIGNIDGRCTSGYDGLDDLTKELGLSARSILRGKLHVVNNAPG